jgi:hypothetical protein
MRTPVGTVLLLYLTAPALASAQVFSVVPSVAVSAISDDNIFTTATTRSADQSTLLSPGIESSITTARGSLFGLYSFDMQRSMTFQALNDLDARRHGIVEATYRHTQRLATAFRGHYDRTENAGELTFETGVLLPRRRASRWELAPSFAYLTSTVVTWRGQYNWVREALQHTMLANEHVARFGVARLMTARTSLSADYLGRHFISGDDTQTSHAALLGWTRALSPYTALSLQAGPRLAARGGLAPEISFSLGRRAPNRLGYAFDYWEGESIILGILGPVEVRSGTGSFTVPVRRNLEFGAAGGVFRSDSQTQGDALVYHAEAVASWSFRPYVIVAGSYSADFQQGDIRSSLFSERNVTRHVFLAKLTIAPRFSRARQPHGPLEPLAGPPQGVQP